MTDELSSIFAEALEGIHIVKVEFTVLDRPVVRWFGDDSEIEIFVSHWFKDAPGDVLRDIAKTTASAVRGEDLPETPVLSAWVTENRYKWAKEVRP